MNAKQIAKIKDEFEYAFNAAEMAGDYNTSRVAKNGVIDCMVAAWLLEHGEVSLAQALFTRTREYEMEMDWTSTEYIRSTGKAYYLSPE